MLNKGNILRIVLIGIILTSCSSSGPATSSFPTSPTNNPPTGNATPTIQTLPTSQAGREGTPLPIDLAEARLNIKHIVIIMQENRSFDQYFGTYPGADGIPMTNGVPTVCAPDPMTNVCVKPYHDANDINAGGPHAAASAVTDINGGKMDGFIIAFRGAQKSCTNPTTPGCVLGNTPDVMGWHDAREIPNYWAYAQNFV
jgi:phospholipase C